QVSARGADCRGTFRFHSARRVRMRDLALRQGDWVSTPMRVQKYFVLPTGYRFAAVVPPIVPLHWDLPVVSCSHGAVHLWMFRDWPPGLIQTHRAGAQSA